MAQRFGKSEMGSLPGRRQNRQVGNGNAGHENAYSALLDLCYMKEEIPAHLGSIY